MKERKRPEGRLGPKIGQGKGLDPEGQGGLCGKATPKRHGELKVSV